MEKRNLARTNIEKVREFLKEIDTGRPFLLGMSGGIDSTALAYLVSKEIGKERLETFTIVGDWLDKTATDHAIDMASNLSSKHSITPITDIYSRTLLNSANPENYAILLGQAITFVNNMSIATHQSLISAHVQETAVELGNFGTYQGEISPIAHFFKSEIYYMAYELGVPKEVINRIPGSGILDTMSDEELIGVPYETLEKYLLNVKIKDNGFKAFSLEYLFSDREGVKCLCGLTDNQLEHLEYRILHAARFWIREGPRPARGEINLRTNVVDLTTRDGGDGIHSPLFRPPSYTISPGRPCVGVIAETNPADYGFSRIYKGELKREYRKQLRKNYRNKTPSTEVVIIERNEEIKLVNHTPDGLEVITVLHGGVKKAEEVCRRQPRYGC